MHITRRIIIVGFLLLTMGVLPVFAQVVAPTLPSEQPTETALSINTSDTSYPCYQELLSPTNPDEGLLGKRARVFTEDLRAVALDMEKRPEELVLQVKQNVSVLRVDLEQMCNLMQEIADSCRSVAMGAAEQQVILSQCRQQVSEHLRYAQILAKELLMKNIFAKQTFFLVRRLEAFAEEMRLLHEEFANGLVQYFAEALRTMDVLKRTPLPK